MGTYRYCPHHDKTCIRGCANGDICREMPVKTKVLRDTAPAVGDVNSDAMGTGARFNGNKPPMETIPVWIIAEYIRRIRNVPAYLRDVDQTLLALERLGAWQAGECSALMVMAALPPEALEKAARVFKHVTERPVKPYPLWNWMKGMPWSVPTACAIRHAMAILRGEENDPETGLPHCGHFMCNLIMLAQYERTWKQGDDRPLKYLSPKA